MPVAELPDRARAVVIGAGIMGSALPHHLALQGPLQVGHLFGPGVDEQRHEAQVVVVGLQRDTGALEDLGLAGTRRGHDERPLAPADGGHEIDDPAGEVILQG